MLLIPLTTIHFFISSTSCRAIIFAWLLIFTTSIPTMAFHGEVQYVHKGEHRTACLFLSEHGYRRDIFQVCSWNSPDLNGFFDKNLYPHRFHFYCLRMWFHCHSYASYTWVCCHGCGVPMHRVVERVPKSRGMMKLYFSRFSMCNHFLIIKLVY
jgi:hypothetical protein